MFPSRWRLYGEDERERASDRDPRVQSDRVAMAGYCTREMRESAGRAPMKRAYSRDGVKKRKKTFDIGARRV